MHSLENVISSLEEKLCDPEIFPNHEKVMTLQSELDQAKLNHETLEMEWLELNEELEDIIS